MGISTPAPQSTTGITPSSGSIILAYSIGVDFVP